jgi:multiple RNA-binding domain-containing protein 1
MRIYVGNLDLGILDSEVATVFAAYGSVATVVVVRDGRTGAGYGYGFVEMDDLGEASAAVRELDGSKLLGREITVMRASGASPDVERPGMHGKGQF